ncbi:uncharacterized protein BDW70DRAFT_156200 [Aspergillus foveolatus]|uniref:uncharacterized protein n=1 Tax=Aspergillus foveolatus TaxID=210207 RepID=UPI003CCD192F
MLLQEDAQSAGFICGQAWNSWRRIGGPGPAERNELGDSQGLAGLIWGWLSSSTPEALCRTAYGPVYSPDTEGATGDRKHHRQGQRIHDSLVGLVLLGSKRPRCVLASTA